MNSDRQDNLPFFDMPDGEGIFDRQMHMPLFGTRWAAPVEVIVKRDGRREAFDKRKIAASILRAAPEGATLEADTASSIASAVSIYLSKRLNGDPASADQVSDAVERVLIQMSQVDAGLAYARYRDRRARIRRLRKGDMQALLSELEEARQERGAGLAKDMELNVQTSQDRLVKWNRSRIVEALQLETRLDAGMASVIAAEVEKQIEQAGITVLTASLVRELVGAKLIEHGLVEENDLRRRLGVPLYDASRIIRGCTAEALCATPKDTDNILARAVKKEYALAEVFSTPVTQAHLLGRIHINELEFVDRLYSCEQHVATASVFGQVREDIPEIKHGNGSPAAVVAAIMKHHDFLQTFFSSSVDWQGFNFLAAPFVARAGDPELRLFARTIIREFAYRAFLRKRSPMRISICWNLPAHMAGMAAPGLESGTGDSYHTLEPVARRLFSALLEAFGAGDASGYDFTAPVVEVVLDDGLFQTLEGNAGLLLAARTALQRPNICFRRKERGAVPEAVLSKTAWGNLNLIWHRVTLNLPRAAVVAEDEQGLWEELDRLCDIAVNAHEEKQEFLEALLDPDGCAPLSPLARTLQDARDPGLNTGTFMVTVDGLSECAEILLGTGQASFAARTRLMENILTHLSGSLKQKSGRAGILCLLAANADPEISRRFAAVDAGLYPRLMDSIIKTDKQTQVSSYTPGTALPGDHALNPYERARVEGAMHALLKNCPFTCMPIPLNDASETTVADLLKKVFYQTTCKGLWLIRNHS